MNFPFSKAFLPTYCSDNNAEYKNLLLYYVYKDNSLLGQYFRHGEQFFTYQDQKIKIQSTGKWFKKPKYIIINDLNGQAIGEFIIPHPYNNSFYHYPEVPYTNPYLKILLLGEEYQFRRERPDIDYWLFDSKTWGHYNFTIYNKLNIPAVRYSFKIENPLLDGSISFYHSLNGNIEADEENLLLLFTGFFLLERFLDDQDRSG